MHPFWGVKTGGLYHAGDILEFGIVKNSGRYLGAFTRPLIANPMISVLIGRADAARLTKPDL
jgi:hypothetical protein